MEIQDIAKICHQANKAYCESLGDTSQPEWEAAPEWQRASAINGVQFGIDKPDATPEDPHINWLKQKKEEGWSYGPVKDTEKKTHPCYRAYADLPFEQRAKDAIFQGIVKALAPYYNASKL